MADLTMEQLRNRILRKLKVLRAGETADASDAAIIEAAIAAVNEKLRDVEICYWADDAFPQAISEDLAAYVACHCADDFMDEGEAQGFVLRNEHKSFAELKRLSASRERQDTPTRAEYF